MRHILMVKGINYKSATIMIIEWSFGPKIFLNKGAHMPLFKFSKNNTHVLKRIKLRRKKSQDFVVTLSLSASMKQFQLCINIAYF